MEHQNEDIAPYARRRVRSETDAAGDGKMRGNITRRGKKSWRIEYDVGAAGERVIRYQTVHGTKRDAEMSLPNV